MITADEYKNISIKYGYVASWAVWAKAGCKPKSNIGKMEIFEDKNNLLKILKTNVVMVGLNFSREVKFEKPFMNFHDSNPHGNDFKIRFAFEETDYYGAYMTDLIKDLPMTSSKDVLIYLKDNPEVLKKQLVRFKEELKFINANKPTIIAFGKDVYNMLIKNLDANEYRSLIQITHYSHQISKEKYRKETHEKLGISSSNTEFFLNAEGELKKIIAVLSENKISSGKNREEVQKLKKLTEALLININRV